MVSLGIEGLALEQWRRLLRVALGEEPADLVLRHARVVNVASGEIEEADVAIVYGRIAGVGDYPAGEREIDLAGAYLAPSFIDGHVHVESSLLWIDQFARAVVPHGTGAVVTDPHEIANVVGLPGIRALAEASAAFPLDVFFTIPSCVPASPYESAGAVMDAATIREGLALPNAVALGEMMNFPGVLAGDTEIYEKLSLPARRRDGHAPGLRGHRLNAYIASGMGSDHESTRLEEAREKLRRGLRIMIREGSTEHNLLELLPLVTDATYPQCCFASDDRDCATLLHDGHVDAIVRKAIAAGLDPIRAIRLATLNTAEYWGLDGYGLVAPGYWANLVVFERLDDIRPSLVLFRGDVVAEDGKARFTVERAIPAWLLDTVHIAPVEPAQLRIPAATRMVAVEAIPGQIVTRAIEVEPSVRDGEVQADPDRDLLKLVVVERHRATGQIGVGLVRGFGLKRGAIGSSIAHDAHNIVVVGVDDADILRTIETIAAMRGGLAAVVAGEVRAQLALPVAGILSPEPLEVVAAQYEAVEQVARELGSTVPAPFALLSFMALSVIPEARVTDRGLVILR
ncbi:adenine deaminase [Thermomicrobium sp. CFH 73360]|uniref:adenine deaminase n=1 Tax=Thermomicrobium sp. CFH 73360 TaxID=2951987 RepID=UPI00207675E3|nr:adenine deaminase [Thermomicrobium sp. CFH 73360]MCM8745066.1 adenine deaminase [Thermomicrobium sp. CFH 73360]